jgi:periplasmic divalent cation tolerance protein
VVGANLTVPSQKIGVRIARRLVHERLAACVNLLPGVVSFYRWKGRPCRDRELLLLIKTTRQKVPALQKELEKLHPYDLPEFIILPIVGGSRRYLRWLMKS